MTGPDTAPITTPLPHGAYTRASLVEALLTQVHHLRTEKATAFLAGYELGRHHERTTRTRLVARVRDALENGDVA